MASNPEDHLDDDGDVRKYPDNSDQQFLEPHNEGKSTTSAGSTTAEEPHHSRTRTSDRIAANNENNAENLSGMEDKDGESECEGSDEDCDESVTKEETERSDDEKDEEPVSHLPGSSIPIESLIVSPTAKRKSPRPKPKSPISDPNFMCEHCGKSWTSNYKLRNHLRVHTKEKPFKCSECEARFTQKYDCERHERAHFGDVRTYDCEVCGRSLASSSSLAKHMTIHTGIKKFKCTRCDKAFPTNGDLTKHVRVHTGEKPYTCDVCGRAFAESSSRNRHRMTHTGEKPHKCQFCFEAFLRPNDLKRHVERRHTRESYQVQVQGSSATVAESLDVPVYDIADIRSGKVALNDTEILLEEVVGEDGEMVYVVVSQEHTKHQESVSGQNSPDKPGNVIAVALDKSQQKNKESETNEFTNNKTTSLGVAELMDTLEQVQELEKLKNSETNLDSGIQIVRADSVETSDSHLPASADEAEKSVVGETAPKKVIDYIVPPPKRRALADNVGDKPDGDDPYIFSTGTSEVEAQIVECQKELVSSKSSKENSEADFMCSSCEETFLDAKDLHQHVQEHLQEDSSKKKKRKRKAKPLLARETHDCSQCDKRYNTQQALVAHMRHHTGPKKDRKFECTTCTWKFPTLYKLTAHMRSHSDSRPYKCPYCEKAYKARGDLRRHVAAHIDPEQAKQYLCSICGAALASTSSLKKHLNIHSGTRNFPCNLCAKSFYSKGDLDKHFRIHTGDKPYKCNVCQRAFAESSTRNSHQRLHSGEKRFECTVCQKRFNRSGDLNRHTRQHTGERRYKCQNCDSSFVGSDALTSHKMRYQDQQTGQLTCKKDETEFGHSDLDQRGEGMDIVNTFYETEKEILIQYQHEKSDLTRPLDKSQDNIQSNIYHGDKPDTSSSHYAREMAAYVRGQEKMDMNIYSREKTDMSAIYQREKVDLSHDLYGREKPDMTPGMYDRQKVDLHSTMYPRERVEVQTNHYYHRPNNMDFTPNPSIYQRTNPMDFSTNFDPYQRPPMPVGHPVHSGQRVLEIREIDNPGGTYRYGFGGTISVVE